MLREVHGTGRLVGFQACKARHQSQDDEDNVDPVSPHITLAAPPSPRPHQLRWASAQTVFFSASVYGQRRRSLMPGLALHLDSDHATTTSRAARSSSLVAHGLDLTSNGYGVNEGPEILQHGAKTYVVFSTCGSWDACYNLFVVACGASRKSPDADVRL
ncbi:hypothetical protein BD626DRAFT_625929 [Schizophyllum amplum]|uniref:Uncharacterized protein n=1 Tax=Schizophyllum amplum TaxID=97359 RepID=A0A550CRS2_9AGAR|nr:hypothetical protein BD626DRAFT_625929 [Auriculariopsis ampla]